MDRSPAANPSEAALNTNDDVSVRRPPKSRVTIELRPSFFSRRPPHHVERGFRTRAIRHRPLRVSISRCCARCSRHARTYSPLIPYARWAPAIPQSVIPFPGATDWPPDCMSPESQSSSNVSPCGIMQDSPCTSARDAPHWPDTCFCSGVQRVCLSRVVGQCTGRSVDVRRHTPLGVSLSLRDVSDV